MKKTYFVLCMLGALSIAQRVLCQSNYQPGYIVTHEGDTIKGLIDFRQWEKNPVTVKFKAVSDENIQTFSALQIHSFFVADEYYIGGTFEIDKTPTRIDQMPDEDTARFVKEDTFLSKLVDGKLNLYFLKDNDAKIHFFIKKGDGVINELIFRKSIKKIDGNKYVYTNQKYKETLIYYMSDDSVSLKKIEDLPYNTKALTGIFKEYNQSNENLKSIYNRNDKIIFSPFLIMGLVKTKYDPEEFIFNSSGTPTEIDFSFPEMYFTYGLGLNIMSSRKLQRFSLYTELIYKSVKFDLHYTVVERANLYRLYNNEANLHILNYSIMPRYQPKFNKVRPFIEAGASLGINVGGTYIETEEKHFYDQITTTSSNSTLYFGSLQAGIGCYYKGLSAELRIDNMSTFFLISYNFSSQY